MLWKKCRQHSRGSTMPDDIESLLQQLKPMGPDERGQYDHIERTLRRLQPRSKPAIAATPAPAPAPASPAPVAETPPSTWRYEYACAALIVLGLAWNFVVLSGASKTDSPKPNEHDNRQPHVADPLLAHRLQTQAQPMNPNVKTSLSTRFKEWAP